MLENEKLDLILSEIQGMKADMQGMKAEIQGMKADMRSMNDRLSGVELHLENVTDRNIRLLAENHMTLIDKLNDSVKVADKSALCEIQVRFLTEKVDKLSKDVDELKHKTA